MLPVGSAGGRGHLVMLIAFWADSAVAVKRMASWLGPVWMLSTGTEPVSLRTVIHELCWGQAKPAGFPPRAAAAGPEWQAILAQL